MSARPPLLTVLAAAALAALMLAPPAGAGASSRVFGVENCDQPEVKPDRIVFACADFGLYANHFDWKH